MYFHDTAWLGTRYADEAPYVRAGLGLLLSQGDWTWWHDPERIDVAIWELVPRSGVLTWGGDEAVLDAHEWLPSAQALLIARTMRHVLNRMRVPRLKIGKEVWNWNAAGQMQAIRLDLANVFSVERIFCEWPEMPTRRRQSPAITTLELEQRTSDRFAIQLRDASEDPRWQERIRTDFAIGSLDELFAQRQQARLVIVVEDNEEVVLSNAGRLRWHTAAQCMVRIGSDPELQAVWLSLFADAWTQNETIDSALRFANRAGFAYGEIIASTTSFILRSRRFFDLADFFGSFGRAGPRVPVSSEAFKLRRLERLVEATPPPVARVLHAEVLRGSQVLASFPHSGPVNLHVNIQPKSPLHGRRPVFPDEQVLWQGESKRLEIHLTELGRQPITMPIEVSRSGASTIADFSYEVLPDRLIDLRFLVSDGARILQTARMQGEPGSPIRFFIEAINTPVERDKQAFDLALLVNDSLGNRPSATVLSPAGISLTVLEGHDIVNARREFLETLQTSVKFPGKDIDETLFTLASKGRNLYRAIVDSIPGWPAKLERVQLMTPSNAFFPIEYLFLGRLPSNASAGLCDYRSECLQSGVARSPCVIREQATKLCPMNFLGITTIVERQTWSFGKPASVFLSEPKAMTERQRITDLRHIVFAASSRADEFEDDELLPGFEPVRIARLAETLGPVKQTWPDWESAVRKNPTLLVLIPHVDDEKIEIGDGDVLLRGALEHYHVGQGRPLVVAIGCNTGEALVPANSLPALFMRNGAGAVIAALTEVLGRYANVTTLGFVEQLNAAAKGETAVSIGSVVTSIRRNLLAQGSVFGMVLVAFGDADYALGGK